MSVGSIDFGDYIASNPDFPKTGMLFRDISPLLASTEGMAQVVDQFAAHLSGFDTDLIAGIGSRGFLFSTLLASWLNIGSMMVRKPGKLPGNLLRAGYDLEYDTAELTIQQDALIQGRSVLIIDDLLATGGAMVAAKTINQEKATNHPVIQKHPVSGAETLFVNAAFTEAINELAADEFDAMICRLYSRI